MADGIGGSAAAELLRELAEVAARGPEPRGTGHYHHIHTTGRRLHVVRVLGGSTTASVEPQERWLWVAEDGSGRLLVTRDGEPVLPTGDYPPGGLFADFLTAADPVATTAKLRARNPKASTAVAVKTFVEVWDNQVVPPALQRLLLLDLADRPGLTEGPGVAVAHRAEQRRTRQLLEFDAGTGALVRAEQVALVGAGVPITTPVTTSSTEWLFSGYTSTTVVSGG